MDPLWTLYGPPMDPLVRADAAWVPYPGRDGKTRFLLCLVDTILIDTGVRCLFPNACRVSVCLYVIWQKQTGLEEYLCATVYMACVCFIARAVHDASTHAHSHHHVP